MDLGDDILNGVAVSIASKNQVLGWNAGKSKSGHILLKIWYDGDIKDHGNNKYPGHILDNFNSEFNPQLSPTHRKKRNFFRSKSFKENSLKSNLLSTSTPVQRNYTGCYAEPVCIVWDELGIAPSTPASHTTVCSTEDAYAHASVSPTVNLRQCTPTLRNVKHHKILTQEEVETHKKKEWYQSECLKCVPWCINSFCKDCEKLRSNHVHTKIDIILPEEIVLKPFGSALQEAKSKSCQVNIPPRRRMTRSLGSQTSRLHYSVPKIKCHNYDPICYEAEVGCTATQDDGLLYLCWDCKSYTCGKKDCVYQHHKLCTCRRLDAVKFPFHPSP